MNIFFLSTDPQECAEYHCDKHVVKMILETCQLLCTAWHILDPDHHEFRPPYKKTHVNHPAAIWVRSSEDNYIWLCALGKRLCEEYTHRYEKIHKSEKVIDLLRDNIPLFYEKKFTIPPLCMPDEYKQETVVDSYRSYYKFEKYNLHSWKKRKIPCFINE